MVIVKIIIIKKHCGEGGSQKKTVTKPFHSINLIIAFILSFVSVISIASTSLIAFMLCIKTFFFLFTGTCGRHVKFTTEKDGYALQGHVIKNLTLELGTLDPCRVQCVMESHCLSINIGPLMKDRIVCELSDSDHTLHPEDLTPRAGFTYTGTEVSN